MYRLVVAITGASGQIYGVRLVQALRGMEDVETHVVISRSARPILTYETGLKPEEVEAMANVRYAPQDMGAPIASGSFPVDAMAVVPCSIKTLSGVVNSYADNLVTRAADVTLKEGRPLLLAVRETPLHLGHLRLMLRAAEMGAIVFPPIPAFYNHPRTLDELVDNTVGRMLRRLGVPNDLYTGWQGWRP